MPDSEFCSYNIKSITSPEYQIYNFSNLSKFNCMSLCLHVPNCVVTQIVCCMIIGCSLMELWNLSTTNATFLHDVSSLDDAAQYHSCVHGSVGSAALKDSRLSTSTVAYYTGTTPGSRACFVCDENSGYELNTTTNERICQSDATWSEDPITCGMCVI